jgi:hypothetical protein
MKKYPSIELYKNVIRTVKSTHDYQGKDENGDAIYQHTSDYPVLKFIGTVKLHGTNAGIVKYKSGEIQYQSREKVLSLEQDNANFMISMMSKNLDFLFENCAFDDYVAVYGEWCGGNIQKGVAINGLPKMFVIFGIKIDDKWIELPKDLHDNEQGVYNILQFPTYEIDIDFNKPELSQNKLIEMTLEVEKECPVGKHFGNIGIGEGLVFYNPNNQDLRFKSKGELHSVSKVTTLNSVDVESIEKIQTFVELAVTENRLQQGLQFVKDNVNKTPDQKNTGDFLRWVVNDVMKEEQDTIVASQFDVKKLNSAVSNKARMWYLKQI